MKETEALSAYRGRWIAQIRGQVVAHGGTPEQARAAALENRPKERPEVTFVATQHPLVFTPILERVQSVIPESAGVYLVGGAVRDALLQSASKDLDFAVPKGALKLARKVADKLNGAFYKLDEEHETGRVVLMEPDGSRYELDFAVFRGDSLDADLNGRDFTVNALAVPLHHPQEIHDPLGGMNDLIHKRLKACSPDSLQDDPVRCLRAVRLATAFGLQIEAATRGMMKKAAPGLQETSAERVRDELFKILSLHKVAASIRALDLLGILPEVLPELSDLKGVTQSSPHIYDAWEHTLKVVQALEDTLSNLDLDYPDEGAGNLLAGLIVLHLGRYRQHITDHLNTPLTTDRPYRPLLMLAALFHDTGKPHTRSVEEDGRIRFLGHEQVSVELAEGRGILLHLSNHEIDRLKVVIANHMRPNQLGREATSPSRRAVYRFFRDTGPAGVDNVLLSIADQIGMHGPTLDQEAFAHHLETMRALLEAWWERPEEVRPPLLVDGNDLMREFKLQPGPHIGELLDVIREAQAVGEVKTKGDAYKLIEDLLTKSD
ncbi:MAG: HD domain-containing protein [Anaerolineae bacterium]|nr:MAG: HD domain-containing protein [Anaerolineae bacterium]